MFEWYLGWRKGQVKQNPQHYCTMPDYFVNVISGSTINSVKKWMSIKWLIPKFTIHKPNTASLRTLHLHLFALVDPSCRSTWQELRNSVVPLNALLFPRQSLGTLHIGILLPLPSRRRRRRRRKRPTSEASECSSKKIWISEALKT